MHTAKYLMRQGTLTVSNLSVHLGTSGFPAGPCMINTRLTAASVCLDRTCFISQCRPVNLIVPRYICWINSNQVFCSSLQSTNLWNSLLFEFLTLPWLKVQTVSLYIFFCMSIVCLSVHYIISKLLTSEILEIIMIRKFD